MFSFCTSFIPGRQPVLIPLMLCVQVPHIALHCGRRFEPSQILWDGPIPNEAQNLFRVDTRGPACQQAPDFPAIPAGGASFRFRARVCVVSRHCMKEPGGVFIGAARRARYKHHFLGQIICLRILYRADEMTGGTRIFQDSSRDLLVRM